MWINSVRSDCLCVSSWTGHQGQELGKDPRSEGPAAKPMGGSILGRHRLRLPRDVALILSSVLSLSLSCPSLQSFCVLVPDKQVVYKEFSDTEGTLRSLAREAETPWASCSLQI